MDTGTFRGILTLVLIVAFLGITWWAYSRRRKPDFDEAANLPFAEDDEHINRDNSASRRHDKGGATGIADSRNNRGDKNT